MVNMLKTEHADIRLEICQLEELRSRKFPTREMHRKAINEEGVKQDPPGKTAFGKTLGMPKMSIQRTSSRRIRKPRDTQTVAKSRLGACSNSRNDQMEELASDSQVNCSSPGTSRIELHINVNINQRHAMIKSKPIFPERLEYPLPAEAAQSPVQYS